MFLSSNHSFVLVTNRATLTHHFFFAIGRQCLHDLTISQQITHLDGHGPRQLGHLQMHILQGGQFPQLGWNMTGNMSVLQGNMGQWQSPQYGGQWSGNGIVGHFEGMQRFESSPFVGNGTLERIAIELQPFQFGEQSQPCGQSSIQSIALYFDCD